MAYQGMAVFDTVLDDTDNPRMADHLKCPDFSTDSMNGARLGGDNRLQGHKLTSFLVLGLVNDTESRPSQGSREAGNPR